MRAEELLGDGGGRGFRLVTYHEGDEIIPPHAQLRDAGAVELTGRGSHGGTPHTADLSELPQYGRVVQRVRAEFYRLGRVGRVHTLP